METWAETIKEGRARLGLTQEQLGHEIGVTGATVSRWESGKKEPTIRAIRDRVYHVLGGPAGGPSVR